MKYKIGSFFAVLLSCMAMVDAAAQDTLLTVLNPDDPVPAAKLLSRRTFTGNDPAGDCAYQELLASAKAAARNQGANVVRVNAHRKRTRQQHCDELDISFYQAADAAALERHFSWTAGRALRWTDFKGPVPRNAPADNAAVTNCGIAVETNTVTNTNPVKIYVVNSFEVYLSWVRPEQQKATILQHEQGHFDLCELYTRKMRERFSKAVINVDNLQQVVGAVYNGVMREYAERQQLYEQETSHGLTGAAQDEWTRKIAAELQSTDSWSSK